MAGAMYKTSCTDWATAHPSRELYQSNTSACGALRSADGGQIRLTVTGNHDPITVPLAQITNLTVVPTCE
jgi:hypothetical protein